MTTVVVICFRIVYQMSAAAAMSHCVPPLPADLKQIAVLLDVDGTILDIAPTPWEVSVPQSLRDTLCRLWERTGGALAFVSGRLVSEVDRIFSPLKLPAVGGHGAELRVVAGGATEVARLAKLDDEVKRQFAMIADAASGIILEDKGYSLALHYRLAPDKERLVNESAARIYAALGDPSLELLPGKLVVEVKRSGATKATAVRKLMSHPPFCARRPIFIGDDVTDLGVFKVLPDFAGTSIGVGPVVSGADFWIETPSDVRHWLERMSRIESFATS
jgi:trehalose 6-phosphate phosphatase